MANIQEIKGKKGTRYRVLIRLKGCPAQSATFARKTDAKKWAAETESAIRAGRYFKTVEAKRHTVAEMIDRYIADVVPNKKDQVNTTNQLLYWKAQIGHLVLADVTTAKIVAGRDLLLKEPYTIRKTVGASVATERRRSPATVNRYMAAISHCFTVAVTEWQWLEVNPAHGIKKQGEPRGRIRFLSDDERERLLAACLASPNPLLYPAVVLALSTGMRHGEIMNLTWADVDFENQRITLHDTKNGERRVVHLMGKALLLLQELKTRNLRGGSHLVFPGKAALNNGPASIRTAWLTALRKAEIADFHFHDLRHSAASYLAMNGAALLDIAAILGHKTLSMVKRYSHLSDSHVGGVVAAMNEKIFGE
ncbi:tyrosine-type recombinase/integrase [Desulfobulbus elongatus]|uniref:tyrosine-type recombinase/integrase n=1 Tax=Desulfobulbus elongatus TaxID=53332 RepID=UPI00047FD9D1|nr:site-specific integrase [Desulfobulbus elongatus]